MKPPPEAIPDVSLLSYPMLAEPRSERLREKQHAEMQRERTCHAFRGIEYHYCGRKQGRLFPLAAPEPTPPSAR